MPDTTPRIQPPARLQGRWTADALAGPGLLAALDASLRAVPPQAAWDLRDAVHLDHVGAQLLWNRWGRRWPAEVRLEPAQQAILERVARWTSSPPAPSRRAQRASSFIRLGGWLLHAAAAYVAFVILVGGLAGDTVRLLRAPARGPWRDLSSHLYRMGATALPITALVGFLIGVVLAYLTSQQLRAFGADVFIVNILGLSVIRELGPLLAAVLIAGRSGSAITAQIGAMRLNDELDAMRVLGIEPGQRLVLPRVLALVMAQPLLTAWTTLCALAGGMLAADVSLGISPRHFLETLPNAVPIANLVLALAKAAAFGALIALVGCHFGLRVQPDAQSLGRGTTGSVVCAITGVILVDALFAVLFQGVGL